MNNEQFVGFVLGKEHYGVDIMGVEEIIRMVDITPVPRAPSFVEGIINLRNQIIPVVDLRERLRIPAKDHSENTRIIVMKLENRKLGFIVDKVEEVMHISQDQMEPAPGMPANARLYVEGIARTKKGMVIVLDILKIFSPDEQREMVSLGIK